MGEPNWRFWTGANNDPNWRRVDEARRPGGDDPHWRFHRTPEDDGETGGVGGVPFNHFGDPIVGGVPFNHLGDPIVGGDPFNHLGDPIVGGDPFNHFGDPFNEPPTTL